MAGAKIISMIDHAVHNQREAYVRDLEMAIAVMHRDYAALIAKISVLRYDVDKLIAERDKP